MNEQPHDYWRQLFVERGYRLFDGIRPLVKAKKEVEWWYRCNMFLYANEVGTQTLSQEMGSTYVAPGEKLDSYLSPLRWVLHGLLLRLLPSHWITQLAQAKHALVRRRRSTRGRRTRA